MAQGQRLQPRVPRRAGASGCHKHRSPERWDLPLALGWGCFLPPVTKHFSTGEVNESLARLETTSRQQFQLVS